MFLPAIINAQKHSVARSFIETALINAKESGAGPTIIARNLFYTSAAMYDAWAFYNKNHKPYLLGNQKGTYKNDFDLNFKIPDSLINQKLIEEAISYAAYRLLIQKHSEIQGKRTNIDIIDSTFKTLGYDPNYTDINYKNGKGAALGNYIAECYIQLSFVDNSNEDSGYEDLSFQTVNPTLNLTETGPIKLEYPNRWQPISAIEYINNKGIDPTLKEWNMLIADGETVFLTPQWANVLPFALNHEDTNYVIKDGRKHLVYFDPGKPPQLNFEQDSSATQDYIWNFSLVGLWSSLLDPSDSEKIDISPSATGKLTASKFGLKDYYLPKGEKKNKKYKVNPKTKLPYKPNIVKKADYLRVIAEYWVDGINTYSPPGHWFATLNKVSNHPSFEKKWNGKGEVLSALEWDIKSYFTLGGALHDAAIAAWGVKVAYDYVRPISAIRYMASKGQSSLKNKDNYHPHGLPLIDGKIEIITAKDPLAKKEIKNIGKLKIYAWRGPNYITDVRADVAGVGWILAEDWWPYQRYSFVTPPFSGYVSGHSCFSFAGATVLEEITGDNYFPGGIAEFTAKKNEFLLFENGPSEDVTLQWATYKSAAIETCLSRIYGGIHPPCDDMKGRIMGEKVGMKAFETVQNYFPN